MLVAVAGVDTLQLDELEMEAGRCKRKGCQYDVCTIYKE